MKYIKPTVFFLLAVIMASAQNPDSIMIKKIYDQALLNGHKHKNLEYLCNQIDPRFRSKRIIVNFN